ncbi:MAG TPA: hypothetical protein VGH90_06880 [Chthoniobacteraceae bacterium]|jgi:hypothetical protein
MKFCAFTSGAIFALVCFGSVSVRGETFILKDGRTVTAKSLRRQGDTIMATVETASSDPSQAPQTGELGYPVAQIQRIEFPEPGQLRNAAELIIRGKNAEALVQLDPVMRYYQGIRDIPGSWWADTAMLQIRAMVGQGRTHDADALIDDFSRLAVQPETVIAAKAFAADSAARHGDAARALDLSQAVVKEGTRPDALAVAYIAAGESHLARKEWEPALLAFLEVPVFYPEEKLWLPPALLGSAQAYREMEEFTHAKETLDNLVAAYADSPEALQAKTEREKLAKAERLAALKK